MQPQLHAALKEQQRSQAWLARRIGCSRALVCRVMNGERQPTHEFRIRAAAALGLPQETLFPRKR